MNETLQNWPAERAAIASLIEDVSGFESNLWKPEFFTNPYLQRLFKVVENLPPAGRPSAFAAGVARSGLNGEPGAADEVGEVLTIVDCGSPDHWHRILSDLHRRRKIAEGIHELQGKIEDPYSDIGEGCDQFKATTEKVFDAGSGIQFADWESILRNESLEPEAPSVSSILPSGRNLFYSGRVSMIMAEPASGKSFLSLLAVDNVIRNGGKALVIDPEDSALGWARRARSIGLDTSFWPDKFKYVEANPETIRQSIAWAKAERPELIVLDGFAEILAGHGLDEISATDVTGFFSSVLRPLARTGAAVVVSDHVTKSKETRGRWSRGSGAKLGAIDGLAVSLDVGKAFSPTQSGFVRVVVCKDRNGGAGAEGQCLAEMHFEAWPDGSKVELREPEQQGPWKPTELMAKICDHLSVAGQAGKRELRSLGKASYVDQAIEALLSEDKITMEVNGQRHIYKLNGEKNDA